MSTDFVLRFVLFVLTFLFSSIEDTLAVKLLGVVVPEHVHKGQWIELTCAYQLEGDTLYALSWTFNGKEFYRYVPGEHPRVHIFPLPHFEVNPMESNEGTVQLHMLNRTASGVYRCEIATEHNFRTLNAQKQIFVAINGAFQPTGSTLIRYFSIAFCCWSFVTQFNCFTSMCILMQSLFRSLVQTKTRFLSLVKLNLSQR